MKSFAILRTNVGLTTNVKIMIDSNYNLSLNSIESVGDLGASKFKKVTFNKNNYYDELIPYFYDGLPSDIAFSIKYDGDRDLMTSDYSNQYDEIYQYGARNIINNKDYTEEYEYFAPLYISPYKFPKGFIVFRVDGPGVGEITKNNFKSEIVNQFKTVKFFDLSNKFNVGQWLETNYKDNSFFPLSPFEMSFDNLEFSKWNGIDYDAGGYTSKSLFLESLYEIEREIFELERFVFDGYKRNKVVFPNILNLSFLFDDTPANEKSLRKWSINRYYGFYLDDLEKVTSISPYITPFIKQNTVIQEGNILYNESGDPFVEGFMDHLVYYIEYLGEYYKVEKFTQEGNTTLQNVTNGSVVSQQYTSQTLTKYRIISDVDLEGKESLINKNFGYIKETVRTLNNTAYKLTNYDNTDYSISNWDSADVWLIEIDGVFHNLIKDTEIRIENDIEQQYPIVAIRSDFGFKINQNDYEYWINSNDPNYKTKVSFVVDKNNSPKKFNIYRCKFTDIKDFDDRIVDTEYSKFEYEKKYELTNTDESKMYFPDLTSNSQPKDIDDFTYKNETVYIPVSSEYTANYETFKITNNDDLSEIWSKNSVYCRWGFQDSLSSNDVPYLLNNSLLFEYYNRTTNPFNPRTERSERTLDYFYTINSSTSSYIHHTLHVEDHNDDGTLNTNFKFEMDKYLGYGTYSIGTQSANYDFDYFSYFFDKKTYFDNGKFIKNAKKYSLFNKGNMSVPNITVFKGLKFNIYDVEDIKKNDGGGIGVLNLKTSNSFEDYKFSILLSKNDFTVINNSESSASATMSSAYNTMTWTIFDDWKMDKTYNIYDIVVIDDILYQSTIVSNITTEPAIEYNSNFRMVKTAPYNQTTKWSLYTPFTNTIFWRPTGTYPGNGVGSLGGDVVYNHGDYYYVYNASGTEDFWSPTFSDSTGYADGDVVLFKGKYYMSMTASNHHRPDFTLSITYPMSIDINTSKIKTVSRVPYWTEVTESDPKWKVVEIWNPSKLYTTSQYIVHNDVLYSCGINGSQTGNEPGISLDWTREYSLIPDTNIVYNNSTNPIIEMNGSYYMCTSNSSGSTLENGIDIYINKRWKNVLINITIDDNTISNLSNTDRDDLYNELNDKLTSNNFLKCINDLANKYGFTDYVNYIIIDENNNLTKYSYDKIEGLPHYIICSTPEPLDMNYHSLIWKPVEMPKNLKITKKLSFVDNSLSNINYYNGVPIAAKIHLNTKPLRPQVNYNGSVNVKYDTIFRFSGFYSPIFYDIQLFSKNFYTYSVGNYKFDTDLNEFGIIKERKIRKTNHNKNILKLTEIKDSKSMYPMIDEFGYTVQDLFIFKSTWDSFYHILTDINVETPIKPAKPITNLHQNNVGVFISNAQNDSY